MRFKNLRTGNIVSTENKGTIALMQKSDNYEVVKAPKKPKEPEESKPDQTEAKA